jgi:hypothetical protein
VEGQQAAGSKVTSPKRAGEEALGRDGKGELLFSFVTIALQLQDFVETDKVQLQESKHQPKTKVQANTQQPI